MAKDLTFRVTARTAEFERKMDNVSAKLRDMGGRMQQMGKSMSMYVTAPIVAMGALTVRAFNKQEAAERKLRAALAANGRQVNSTFRQYQEFSQEMQRLTIHGDEAVLEMLQVAESMDLTGEAAQRAVKNAIGLEAAFGVNAEAAMRMTAALEQGDATMLRRYIPALRGVKDDSEAVAKAQDILGRSFNIATEHANSSEGAMIQMKNAVGDLMESFGAIISEYIVPFANRIKELAENLQTMDESTRRVIAVVAGLAAAIGPLLITLGILTKTVIPALIVGGKLVAAAWFPLTAIVLGVAAAFYLLNRRAREVNEIMDRLGDESTEKLKKRLQELRKELGSTASDELVELNRQFHELDKQLKNETNLNNRIAIMQKMSELSEKIGRAETISGRFQDKATKEKWKEVEAIEKILQARLKEEQALGNISAEHDKILESLEKAAEKTGEFSRELGLAGMYMHNIQAFSEELKFAETIDAWKAINRLIDEAQHNLELIANQPERIAPRGMEVESGGIDLSPLHQLTNEGLGEIEVVKNAMIDLNNFLTNVLIDSFIYLGETIGKAFAGEDFDMSGILSMLGRWMTELGVLIFLAGNAMAAFKNSLAINPALATAAGLALIAAGAAVSAYAASSSQFGSGGGSGGGGGGGRGGGDALGVFDFQPQFRLNIQGQLTGRGSDLVAVIDEEQTRISL